MKVVLVNGSRREKGCTYTALNIIAETLQESRIETALFFIGEKAMHGQATEAAREVAAAMKEADGLIVGSPVYYASASGEVVSFLDRLFAIAEPDLRYKPAASIASARRAGTTATLDVLNKYFQICQMPVVSSRYWNMVHGSNPEEVLQDEEGVQIMRTLAVNMAWLLKCIEAGKAAGITLPAAEEKIYTNFIR